MNIQEVQSWVGFLKDLYEANIESDNHEHASNVCDDLSVLTKLLSYMHVEELTLEQCQRCLQDEMDNTNWTRAEWLCEYIKAQIAVIYALEKYELESN
jgi:hypothetical protein